MIDLCKNFMLQHVYYVSTKIRNHDDLSRQSMGDFTYCTILLVTGSYEWIVVKLDTIIDNLNFILLMIIILRDVIFVYGRELE